MLKPNFHKTNLRNTDSFTQVSAEELLRMCRLFDRRFGGLKHALDIHINSDGLGVPVEQKKLIEVIEEFRQNKTRIDSISFGCDVDTPDGDDLRLATRWVFEKQGHINYEVWARSGSSDFVRINDWGRNTISELVEYVNGLGDHVDATLVITSDGIVKKVTPESAATSSVTHNVTNIHNSNIHSSPIATGSSNNVNLSLLKSAKRSLLERVSWLAAVIGVPIALVGLWLAWLALK